VVGTLLRLPVLPGADLLLDEPADATAIAGSAAWPRLQVADGDDPQALDRRQKRPQVVGAVSP
jgi:hypothetical protein